MALVKVVENGSRFVRGGHYVRELGMVFDEKKGEEVEGPTGPEYWMPDMGRQDLFEILPNAPGHCPNSRLEGFIEKFTLKAQDEELPDEVRQRWMDKVRQVEGELARRAQDHPF